ncbi:hypothetical protein ACHAPT_010331 [Fusarium lateritium]
MNPPPSPSDTHKIWNAFSGVLEGLHHLNLAAIDADFQTIHQDIKPDNLLVSKPASSQPYDIKLVITDFGYSHTKALRASQDTWGIDSHGGQVLRNLATMPTIRVTDELTSPPKSTSGPSDAS